MIRSRYSPVPLANMEWCDRKNFQLIVVTIQADKSWKNLSRVVYKKIYWAMQIDMGPDTHRAILKLTFEQEGEVLMVPNITDMCIYVK